MCKYPLQKHKYKHKGLFSKLPVLYVYIPSLHVYHPLQQHKHKQEVMFPKIPVLHVYIPATTTQIYTQRLVDKIPSLTCVNILYNNTNINTNFRRQNSQYYMCKYPIQQHKHKHKGSFPAFAVSHMYITSTITQT